LIQVRNIDWLYIWEQSLLIGPQRKNSFVGIIE
jgi:hypothetical protein